MIASRPAVYPVEAPPLTDGVQNELRIRMKAVQGMPGTTGGLFLRVAQFVFGLISICVMATTSDFRSVTAFCYLAVVVGLQVAWSFGLVIVDFYALSVGRSLRKCKIVRLFAIGDGVTSTLTFTSACASAGITVLIGNDLDQCSGNHCARFEAAVAMAFISWFAAIPSFLINFWSLASCSD